MKKKIVRGRKLEIENPSQRNDVEKGFDEMVNIALGNADPDAQTTNIKSAAEEKETSNDFLDKIHEEDKQHSKNKIILWTTIIAVIIIAIVGGILYKNHIEDTDGKIRVNYASSDLEGENYLEVVSKLEDEGFTNIRTESIDDLINGWLTKDGEVESVSIDGDTEFSSNSRFLPSSEIVISYHTFSN